ncbi:peptide ABC transporter substrate-binding protein [Planococcus sp. MB-3u-09]|nr:peptide ABC transporter substrate-binding protein [Planococcus sp. MB-3u-03]PKG45534.1 peptide ABC transporter substrate-binding protein [Planococcus sp. Urea-trap-24]PKG89245.1 peptide ABC transporter substrate-binding protein [Planococcus sp. Urea-3u-39]PKH39378.1 peptide ABC transporter substrate-binding protein [Planococcus sp. MB-3u-09]
MKRNKAWALAVTASLAALLAACGGDQESATDTESTAAQSELDSVQELRLTTGSGVPTMDSVMADDAVSFTMLNNAGEGLYRLDQQNAAIPAMASGEPEISEDGLTYTFKLRDAKWSDGSPVTAHDFVFAWQRAADPETGSTYGPYMMAGTIKNAAAIAQGELDKSELGITAQDDQTLVVSLERPIPYFLSLMAFGTFYPQKEAYVTEHGDQYAMDSDKLLSNGPFVLANWDATAASWELEKNPEYWDAETVKLDKVEFNIVPDPGTGVNLYETGEADRAGLAGEFAMQYAEDEEVVRVLKPSVYYLQFNQEREGESTALANPKLRKALALSFNKQDLADIVLANGSIPADFLVPTEFTFDANNEDFRQVNGDMMEFNAEESKALWAEGLEEEGLTEVSLEYLSGDTELSKKIDAYMKDQMEGNLEGLTLEMSQVPFNVLLDKNEAQDYDIQSTGWGPDFQDPITFLDLFATESPQNTMAYSNEQVDALLEQANGELALKPQERWQALAEVEKILVEEDAAIANMYQFGSMALQKPYVHDVITHPFTGDFSYKWAYISGRE